MLPTARRVIVGTVVAVSLVAIAPVAPSGAMRPRGIAPDVHYASVPVRVCRSFYASSGAGTHFPKIPRWKAIAIPGDLTDRVAVYTDPRQDLEFLGPNGWSCDGTFGNGNLAFTIWPPSETAPGLVAQQGGKQKPSKREGINFVGYAASVALWQLVCPYFRTARVDLYRYAPFIHSSVCRLPHGERVVPVNRMLKRVDDPPHKAGDNYPSGGAEWALGNAFYGDYGGGSTYLLTCTMPSSLHSLCYASLAWFYAHLTRVNDKPEYP
jgi:hypothetical protein